MNPYFVVDDAEQFLGFLVTVFGGTESGQRELRADGAINHADVMIGDSIVMVSAASREFPARPCVAFTYVDDVDATYARAVTAGSSHVLEPTDQPWGDRVAGVSDPFGNRWWIATHLGSGSAPHA